MTSRVLVVDDDHEIRETMIEVLEDNGCEVVGARDGLEALTQLRDPADRWGIVLLDLMMPNMDGRQFREEQLRDPQLSAIPVVLVSARTDVDSVAEELQVVGHVTKPVRLADLVNLVRTHCPGALPTT